MPKSAFIARPATVHVTVLPPVETADWEIEDLNENIDMVRKMFLKELDQDAADTSKDVIRLAQSGNKPTPPVEDHGSKPKKSKG